VAGAAPIHTDLARGFVRGEVVGFEDFKRVGSMKEAKTPQSEASKKYLAKLDAQEGDIDKLTARIKELRTTHLQQAKAYDAFLNSLALE
jgi:hypothetical protein